MRHRRPDAEPVVLAGRYRLVDQAPSGEGEAWWAEDLVLGRPVLVTFPAPGSRPADPRDRATLDTGADGGRAYLVTAAPPVTGNGTQIMPALDLPGPGPAVPPAAPTGRRGQGRLLPLLVAGLVIVAVIAVLTMVLSDSDSASPGASGPQASAPAEQASSPAPARPKKAAHTPKASASASPPSTPQGPMGLLSAFQQRLDQQAANGQLDPKVVKNVRKHVTQIAEKLSEGKTEDIHGKLMDIRAKLRDAAREGKWTADSTAAQLLQQLLDAF